ncbi:MAG: WXG100 family type VII secretion target [Nakamurella sp.]
MTAPGDGSIVLSFSALQAAEATEATEAAVNCNPTKLRARLDQLEGDLQPLVSTWSGDAQAAYLIQKKQWEQAAQDLALMLQSIVLALGNTNTDYTGAQRRIVASFS